MTETGHAGLAASHPAAVDVARRARRPEEQRAQELPLRPRPNAAIYALSAPRPAARHVRPARPAAVGRCGPLRPRASRSRANRRRSPRRPRARRAARRLPRLRARAARRAQVLGEAGDRLLGIALVGPEDAGRPALDPSDGVDAGSVEHAPVPVGQHEGALVERHARGRTPGSRRSAGRAALIVSVGASVARARSSSSSERTISLRRTSIASTRPSPRIPAGELRKRSSMRRGASIRGGRSANSPSS